MKGQEYNIQGLDEYIRQSEPQKRERSETKILSEETTPIQSADSALNLLPKCKSCTLEEIAVLRIVQNNPNATQKETAAKIGKSERTVKTITVTLQEKGLLRRVGGKRNGNGNGILYVNITRYGKDLRGIQGW